jgi:hypothetical protein
MEQNLQLRVQILPSIRTVAVPLAQHWPRLGQFALLQIVCRWSDFRICSVRRKESPAGKGLLSQEGSLLDLRLISGILYKSEIGASKHPKRMQDWVNCEEIR